MPIPETVARAAETVANQPIKEGELTKKVENQTAKIPSIVFLNLALGSVALSAGLALNKRTRNAANFIGLWAPTLLLLGIYNKLVKIQGNDRFNRTDNNSH